MRATIRRGLLAAIAAAAAAAPLAAAGPATAADTTTTAATAAAIAAQTPGGTPAADPDGETPVHTFADAAKSRLTATTVPHLPDYLTDGRGRVSAVVAGSGSALALREGVPLWVGGASSNLPASLSEGGVTAAAVGPAAGLAVKDGNVQSWSDYRYCDGEGKTWTDMPAALASGGGATVVEFTQYQDDEYGDQMSFAVKDGKLYQWGCTAEGDSVPEDLTDRGVTAVKSQGAARLAVKDGNVHAWGGTPTVPAELTTGGKVTSIALAHGGRTALAVQNGTLHAWGEPIDLPDGMKHGHVASVSANAAWHRWEPVVATVMDNGTLVSTRAPDPDLTFQNHGITAAVPWGNSGNVLAVQAIQRDATLHSQDGYLTTRTAAERDYLGLRQTDTPGDAETYSIVELQEGGVALKSRLNGKYVMVDQSTNGAAGPTYHLRAVSGQIGPWEKFDLQRVSETSYVLKSSSTGRYVWNSTGTLSGAGDKSQALKFELSDVK
ncbi:hypothetical protein [Streptomyces sp. NPDC008121]|uniref:hypothetical protein n=1 Tax=Streptomyces sp. NPDC008121 TaxID=3364809 RepID=UPI0036E6D160